MGYSLWGHKESDTTEQLTLTHTHTVGDMYVCVCVCVCVYVCVCVCVYKIEYHSATKKMNFAICSNMDGPGDYHTK